MVTPIIFLVFTVGIVLIVRSFLKRTRNSMS